MVFVMGRNKLQRTCLFLIVKETEKFISVKCQNGIKHLTFDTMLLTVLNAIENFFSEG